MFTAIIYALGACALWGLVFIVPGLLPGFSPFEIAIGRCTIFGLFSFAVFTFQRKALFQTLFQNHWKEALRLSLVANILHYVALIMGLTLGNVLLTTMILGLNPVVISWYEYYKQKDQCLQLRGLVPPSLLIIFGLLMTHIAIFDEPISIRAHILGVLFGGLALATWAWFIVSNASFLKRHPKIPIHDWVTVLGIATLFWGIVALLCSQLLYFTFGKNSFSFCLGGSMTSYLLGSLALGIGSSWGAQYLWNHATQRLPLVLTGLLGIFETLFGLLFFYLLEGTLPTPVISFGITIIFLGIVMAICNGQKTILLINET